MPGTGTGTWAAHQVRITKIVGEIFENVKHLSTGEIFHVMV